MHDLKQGKREQHMPLQGKITGKNETYSRKNTHTSIMHIVFTSQSAKTKWIFVLYFTCHFPITTPHPKYAQQIDYKTSGYHRGPAN